jgi:hypothetical protein|tara:strand:- start:302 stop:628 length:327 start_codon:yes stop_codon:yes gene_type:complete
MSRLLSTRLPIANDEVTTDTYNRLVRVLELNLGSFNPDNTRQINTPERDKLYFDPGTIIWNTTIEVLQVYTGNTWLDIGTPKSPQGFQADTSVGKLTVTIDGDTIINI